MTKPEIITLYLTDCVSWSYVLFMLCDGGLVAVYLYECNVPLCFSGLAGLAVFTVLYVPSVMLSESAAKSEAAEKWTEEQAYSRISEMTEYPESGTVARILEPDLQEVLFGDACRRNGFYCLRIKDQIRILPEMVSYGYRRILAEARMALQPALGDVGSRPWITERSSSPDRVRARAEAFLRALAGFPAAIILTEGKGWYSLTATALLKDFVPPQDDTAAAWYRAFESAFGGSAIPESLSSPEKWAEVNLKLISSCTFADEAIMARFCGNGDAIQELADRAVKERMIVFRTEFMRP